MNDLTWTTLKKLMLRSIQSCGRYGSLMFSGLKIKYKRTCKDGSDVDPSAELKKVIAENGEVLFDSEKGIDAEASRTFLVATLDFLSQGGSGYAAFLDATVSKTIGIAREIIAEELSRNVPTLSNQRDGRLMNESKILE